MSACIYSYNPYYAAYLAHHGIKGMHWGIRRYQPYTKGQKGVFKNLKRDYKDQLKNLKRAKRNASDDDLAVAGIRRQIRDLKKSYRTQRREVAREFDKENYEDYKQKVVDTGSESEIKKIKKDLTADQLSTAINRITKLKELDKLNMRDVEAEVKEADALRKLDKISKIAGTASSVINAINGAGNAARTFNLNKREKEQHDLNMKKGEEELRKMAESTRFQKNMADKAAYDAENSSASAANQRIKNRQAEVDIMKSKWGNDYYDKIRERAETKYKADQDLQLQKLMKKYDDNSYSYSKGDSTINTNSSPGTKYTYNKSSFTVPGLSRVANTSVSSISSSASKSSILDYFTKSKSAAVSKSIANTSMSDVGLYLDRSTSSGRVASDRYIKESHKNTVNGYADNSSSSRLSFANKALDSYSKSFANSKNKSVSDAMAYAKSKGMTDYSTLKLAVDDKKNKYFNKADREAAEILLKNKKYSKW